MFFFIQKGAVRTEFTLVRFGQDAEREDDFYKGFTPLNARTLRTTSCTSPPGPSTCRWETS